MGRMSVKRVGHTAWTPPSLPDSIVLLGGVNSYDGSATELTAERVPGGGGFDLSHSGAEACGIPDAGDTIVLTGGVGHNYVTRYDVNGFVEELPQLPENRRLHACGALPATGAFVVAGGITSVYTSSVLTLLPGAENWTPLDSLPRLLYGARASIVGGRLRVTGGRKGGYSYRSEVLEYHPEPLNQWSLMGHLQNGKAYHAVLSVGSQQLPCLSTETTTSSGEDSSTTNDPPTEFMTIGFYIFIGMVCFVAALTIGGLIFMIKTNCHCQVQCCFTCKDAEIVKEDRNLDYGTYYYDDGERRTDVVENPEYDSLFVEGNMDTMAKENNPQYME